MILNDFEQRNDRRRAISAVAELFVHNYVECYKSHRHFYVNIKYRGGITVYAVSTCH